MVYTSRLGYLLVLWALLVVVVSIVSISETLRVILLVFLLGIGSWTLGFIANLKRLMQLLFLIYVIIIPVVLYVYIKPTSMHDINVILAYIPILLYALYSWLKRPKVS